MAHKGSSLSPIAKLPIKVLRLAAAKADMCGAIRDVRFGQKRTLRSPLHSTFYFASVASQARPRTIEKTT